MTRPSYLHQVATDLAGLDWVLIGGAMVQLHCEHAGIVYSRPTHDVDIVVDTAGSTTVSDVCLRLDRCGYAPQYPLDHSAHFHRFTNEQGWCVDVLTKDDSRVHKMWNYILTKAPGTHSALGRYRDGGLKERVVVDAGEGVLVTVPNVWSALALKGRAYRTPGANRVRHIQDAIALFACAGRVGDTRALTKSERRAVNFVLATKELGDVDLWVALPMECWTDVVDAITLRRPRLDGVSLPNAVRMFCGLDS